MERSSLEALFRALERAGARYLVADALAVLAHGFVRVTFDVDLVLDLEPPHPEPALGVFEELGLRPQVPVALRQFADPAGARIARGEGRSGAFAKRGRQRHSPSAREPGRSAVQIAFRAP